jgi:hypothetical protein
LRGYESASNNAEYNPELRPDTRITVNFFKIILTWPGVARFQNRQDEKQSPQPGSFPLQPTPPMTLPSRMLQEKGNKKVGTTDDVFL